MVRSELVQHIAAKNPALTAYEAENVVTTFFDTIAERLAADGRVELRGFGSFSTRTREARAGRNPRTGGAIEVTAKRIPYFRAGTDMKAMLNR